MPCTIGWVASIALLVLCVSADAQQVSIDDAKQLGRRLEAVERKLAELETDDADDDNAGPVDLSEDIDASADDTSMAFDRWIDRFKLSGFGAAGFIDSGNTGLRPDGDFIVHDSSLFVSVQATDTVSFFSEIFLSTPISSDRGVGSGELYLQIDELFEDTLGEGLLVKIGRFDLPFGSDYLHRDSPDNPLITTPVALPYGWDEGILVEGGVGPVEVIAAVTNGDYATDRSETRDKAVNLKLSASPIDGLVVSSSFMRTGRAARSAVCFNGSLLQPVGASDASSAGTSPSSKVSSLLYSFDAEYRWGSSGQLRGNFGQASIDDDDSTFDRKILWFSLEGSYRFTPSIYAAARHSEVGTYSSRDGYHFRGKPVADGNNAFGYDTSRLRRTSLGIGWQPRAELTFKVEVAHDDFDLIDVSTFDASDHRDLVAFMAVLSF